MTTFGSTKSTIALMYSVHKERDEYTNICNRNLPLARIYFYSYHSGSDFFPPWFDLMFMLIAFWPI